MHKKLSNRDRNPDDIGRLWRWNEPYLDVGDEQLVHVEVLHLGVGLGVAEQTENELARLLWPAGLAVGGTSSGSLKSSTGN